MSDKTIKKDDFSNVLQELKDDYEVFVPVKGEEPFHSFKPLEGKKEVDFSFANTRLSPKSFTLPQSERMFEFNLDETGIDPHIVKDIKKDYKPTLLAGIRPCDAKAFALVRKNFDTQEFKDPWWINHMESLTLIGLGCNEPCNTCFCTSVGGGPFNEDGLDVLLYDLEENFLVRSITEKGEKLLEKAGLNQQADSAAQKKADELKTASEEKIISNVPVDKLKGKNVNTLFNAPFWDDVAFPCINCGTCTFLCPTCWCFDIQDEVVKNQGDRMRNWDSCMFPLFTLHASGHNPRSEKVQRVRQRFMHKLKYYVDKYNNGVACVGCGRCVKYCPVNIDIRDVFKLMNDL